MKIAVVCKSPLLQKGLELFLQNHLSIMKHCDLVVCDVKIDTDTACLYISQEDADLKKPFTKAELFLAIEQKLNEATNCDTYEDNVLKPSEQKVNFSILQERIEQLTLEYQNNILKVIKLFYET